MWLLRTTLFRTTMVCYTMLVGQDNVLSHQSTNVDDVYHIELSHPKWVAMPADRPSNTASYTEYGQKRELRSWNQLQHIASTCVLIWLPEVALWGESCVSRLRNPYTRVPMFHQAVTSQYRLLNKKLYNTADRYSGRLVARTRVLGFDRDIRWRRWSQDWNLHNVLILWWQNDLKYRFHETLCTVWQFDRATKVPLAARLI